MFNEHVALHDYSNLNPPPCCYRRPAHTHEQTPHTHCPELRTQMDKGNLRGFCALQDAGKIGDKDEWGRGTRWGETTKENEERWTWKKKIKRLLVHKRERRLNHFIAHGRVWTVGDCSFASLYFVCAGKTLLIRKSAFKKKYINIFGRTGQHFSSPFSDPYFWMAICMTVAGCVNM